MKKIVCVPLPKTQLMPSYLQAGGTASTPTLASGAEKRNISSSLHNTGANDVTSVGGHCLLLTRSFVASVTVHPISDFWFSLGSDRRWNSVLGWAYQCYIPQLPRRVSSMLLLASSVWKSLELFYCFIRYIPYCSSDLWTGSHRDKKSGEQLSYSVVKI